MVSAKEVTVMRWRAEWGEPGGQWTEWGWGIEGMKKGADSTY